MIGVVGRGSVTARLSDAIDAAGASALVADATEVADASPSAIVAVGETALADVARADVDVAVLPFDAAPAFEPCGDSLDLAIERLLDGEYETRSLPILDASLGGTHVDRALFDVMLDTAEPGRISEYGVAAGGRSEQFRADGVVVATPAGSRGYANAAGGPVLDRGIAAVDIVPIAAFERAAHPRVAAPPVTLTVERDECPVSLLVDGRERQEVAPGRPVEVSIGGELAVVEPRPGLEKH